MSKSFLIDTIMHEKEKLILRQQPPMLTSRESSPLSDRSPRYGHSPGGTRYVHSPGSSPRTPPSPPPHTLERHLGLGRSHHTPTSMCGMRGPTMCTCCHPNAQPQQPICTLCEPGPREGEAAPSHKLYQFSRESQPCSRHIYGSDRPRMYPMGTSLPSHRIQFSPNYGKNTFFS